MDLRAKIRQTLPWLLQKRTLWVILILLVISPPIWLGWTQPWQYQPQVPTGPLPEEVAQRLSYPLPPEIQAAKDEGMRLWGLQTPDSMDASEPLLELAAEYGDGDAMYFLGELQRRSSMGGFSTSAMEWYVQGARAGEVYSMLRLHQAGICLDGTDTVVDDWCSKSRLSWKQKAYNQLLPKAQDGNVIAMEDMFNLGAGGRWLVLAAEADNPHAQVRVGDYIVGGHLSGWPYYRYWPKEARLRAALPWYRRAAELGYAPAMARLADYLYSLDEEESWQWSFKAALNGHISQNLSISACYIDPKWSPGLRCQVAQDPVKGLGILIALQRQAGEQITKNQYVIHANTLNAMTDEQRTQAKAFSHEWESRLQAPLSRFPPRWGL